MHFNDHNIIPESDNASESGNVDTQFNICKVLKLTYECYEYKNIMSGFISDVTKHDSGVDL